MRTRSMLVTLVLLAAGLVLVRPAYAASCTGNSVSGTGSIVVPAGGTCTLTGPLTINGGITVGDNATLRLNGVTVLGGITASNPRDVDIRNSYIGGNLIVRGGSTGETYQICNNIIASGASFFSVAANVIFGDSGASSPQGCGPNAGNQVCGSVSFASVTGLLRIQNNKVNGSGTLTNDSLVQFDGNVFGGGVSVSGTSFDSNTNNQSRAGATAKCTPAVPPPAPPATLSCGPDSLTFTNVAIGAYAEQGINCTASGNDVTIGTVTATPSVYTITADGCSGTTLTPAQSCGLSVRFTPTAPGDAPGSVSVPRNGSNTSPIVITLNGHSAAADLSVAKSVSNATPNVGDNVAFTVTATNSGPDAADNVFIVDSLPAGVSFVSASASDGTVSFDGNAVTAELATLASGASVTLTIVATVTQPGSMTNTATVSSASTTDPDLTDNIASATLVAPSADLSIQHTVHDPDPAVGDTVSYFITVGNGPSSTATNVVVHDSLPAGVSFVSAAPGAGTYDSATGVWTIGTLPPNEDAVLVIEAVVRSSGAATATATVSSDVFDPNLANNQASATLVAG
jgi:uncharacterized repeat protein (TIGR01451 family)